ncbi:MAG: acyl-CoA dehydrogenase family protein [Pseudomonadota bacterium]
MRSRHRESGSRSHQALVRRCSPQVQKLAQAHAETEALASLCRFAAWSFNSSSEQRRLTANAAILKAADLGPQVCETAIQCHGGIGFTWEYDLHLYLRRAKATQAAFGIRDHSANELISSVLASAR